MSNTNGVAQSTPEAPQQQQGRNEQKLLEEVNAAVMARVRSATQQIMEILEKNQLKLVCVHTTVCDSVQPVRFEIVPR